MRRLDLLLSIAGQDVLARLQQARPTPEEELRLAATLRREYPAELVAAAFWQHELRVLGQAKFSRAKAMYFTRPGLEQASSELTARHRARRYAGVQTVADLCTGIGGDLIALAAGRAALAVDLDPVHLRMAALNAAVYRAGPITTIESDVGDVSLDGVDAIFIDPARRAGDRRLGHGQSEPPLDWCVGLIERVPAVGVKAAPGLPREIVPPGWEVEFVADGRDLKEAVLWSPALATTSCRATILPAGATMVANPGPPVPVRMPGAYLLDPNPAVTRAGLVEELARDLDAWKIDDQIAFLSADAPLSSPFGRSLRVVESLPWHQKQIASRLRQLDVGAVNIRRRGLPGDVAALHRRLKLTGPRRVTLVMTRALTRPWGLICEDLEPGPDI
ncbi:MAG: THUMP-like domain-containing protein [Thermomicrobiales bacterium]